MATHSASFQASVSSQVPESSQALHNDKGGVSKQQRLTRTRDGKWLDWTDSGVRGTNGDVGGTHMHGAVVHSIEPLASRLQDYLWLISAEILQQWYINIACATNGLWIWCILPQYYWFGTITQSLKTESKVHVMGIIYTGWLFCPVSSSEWLL